MHGSGEKIELWRQLEAVASVVLAIRSGESGTAALKGVAAELRPGVQALTFQVMRSLGRAQALQELLARRAPPPRVQALLLTALALLCPQSGAPYEAYTLVNQAVLAAKQSEAARAQAGFINGCLRRFLREREDLMAMSGKNLVALWNRPLWWIRLLMNEQPQTWQAILREGNGRPPMTLRVNARKATVPGYVAALTRAGLEAIAVGHSGVILRQPRPVQDLPGFADGVVSVQDAAAQLAAPLLLRGLNATSRPRILDACAAPGGKTAHLLEISDAAVTALDIDAQRCERISENLCRLGLDAEVMLADAAETSSWWDGRLFDAILLDAPCSGSGVVRRHPDIAWLRRESDMAQFAATQSRLLNALWPLLKPQGKLLYCTCSIFLTEGENQIQTFLAHNTGARILPSPGHLMPQGGTNPERVRDNSIDDHDGFYFALLEKCPA